MARLGSLFAKSISAWEFMFVWFQSICLGADKLIAAYSGSHLIPIYQIEGVFRKTEDPSMASNADVFVLAECDHVLDPLVNFPISVIRKERDSPRTDIPQNLMTVYPFPGHLNDVQRELYTKSLPPSLFPHRQIPTIDALTKP